MVIPKQRKVVSGGKKQVADTCISCSHTVSKRVLETFIVFQFSTSAQFPFCFLVDIGYIIPHVIWEFSKLSLYIYDIQLIIVLHIINYMWYIVMSRYIFPDRICKTNFWSQRNIKKNLLHYCFQTLCWICHYSPSETITKMWRFGTSDESAYARHIYR